MTDFEAQASFFTPFYLQVIYSFSRALSFTQICSTVPLGLDTMTLGKNSIFLFILLGKTVKKEQLSIISCANLSPPTHAHTCTFLGAKPIYYPMAAYLFTNWHINEGYILQVMKCFRSSLFLTNHICLISLV